MNNIDLAVSTRSSNDVKVFSLHWGSFWAGEVLRRRQGDDHHHQGDHLLHHHHSPSSCCHPEGWWRTDIGREFETESVLPTAINALFCPAVAAVHWWTWTCKSKDNSPTHPRGGRGGAKGVPQPPMPPLLVPPLHHPSFRPQACSNPGHAWL